MRIWFFSSFWNGFYWSWFSNKLIPDPQCLLNCTCRDISIAPSKRMLETLLINEGSLLLT
jgi:hypothetical protein